MPWQPVQPSALVHASARGIPCPPTGLPADWR
jgi:hypothetical protein